MQVHAFFYGNLPSNTVNLLKVSLYRNRLFEMLNCAHLCEMAHSNLSRVRQTQQSPWQSCQSRAAEVLWILIKVTLKNQPLLR